MKKPWLRCVSFVLSVLLFCSALPLSVFAETFQPIMPGEADPNHPTDSADPTTISAALEEEITYGKPCPVSGKTGMLALPHGEKTTGLSVNAMLASGDYPEKYEYRYVWFYAPVYSPDEAMKYSYESMTPLGEDMYGWPKIAGMFSTPEDYADWFLRNAKYNEYIGYSPYFPDVTYADIMGDYWEKYMGGATALAVGCLAILEDASTQAVAACAFTNYNACVTLGGSGSNVKITRVGDAYDGDSVSLRYGSLEDTVPLTVTVNGLEGELSYQWYHCDESASSSSMTPIDGATSATFDAPAPIRKDEEVRYTCGVTAGGETYFPDKAYTIIRSGEAYHRDLSDRAYTSGMTNGGISVYMSYSFIRWLLQSSDDAYMSVEYYSVPSKDSYENATLLCRREPFPCVKLDPTGNTGYLDSYGFPLELGETKYIYAVIYYHGNSPDGEADLSHSSRTNICSQSRPRRMEVTFEGFVRRYGDSAYQESDSLTQRVDSTTSFVYPSVDTPSAADDLAMKTLVDRFTLRVYAVETDVREGGTLLVEKTYTHEELQNEDIGSLVRKDLGELRAPSDTAGVSYLYGTWEVEIDGEISRGVSEKSFKVVTEGTNEDMFVFENGKVTAYKGAEADVIIPSHIGGVRVTEISELSYRAQDKNYRYTRSFFRSVVIPEGVTTIGANAFRKQTGLERVVFPSTLTKIGNYAFDGCSKLAAADFGGLTSGLRIGSYAFQNCSSLKEVSFPTASGAAVSFETDYASFIGTPKGITVRGLKNVAQNSSNVIRDVVGFVARAGGHDAVFLPSEDGQFLYYYHADRDAYSLVLILTLTPAYYTVEQKTIEGSTFTKNYITVKDLPLTFNGKPVIGVGSPYTGAFWRPEYGISTVVDSEGNALTDFVMHRIELNDACTYIGSRGFAQYMVNAARRHPFDAVKLPAALTTVEDHAFYHEDDTPMTIEGLDNVRNLRYIGDYAFSLNFGRMAKDLVFEHDVVIGECGFAQPQGTNHYEFTDRDGCLETLTFRGNAAIGDKAFYFKYDLRSVTFDGSATVGIQAFYECLALESVTLGAGRTLTLSQDAFDGCFNLATVTNITDSNIVDGALASGTDRGFSHFRWTKAFPNVTDSIGGARYVRVGNCCISGLSTSETGYTHIYYVGYRDTDIMLPGTVGEYSVYRIGGEIMRYHRGDGISKFCDDGVEYKLTIGEGITTLDRFTVSGSLGAVDGLGFATAYDSPYTMCTELILPSTLTVIPESAFRESWLRKVTLPSTVTRIEKYAFAGCPIEGTLEIPATVTVIGDGAFFRTNISTLKLHEGLRSIGDHNFMDSYGLSRVITVGKNETDPELQTFPNSLTSIGAGCFYNHQEAGCGLVGTLILPESLTAIGTNAFSRQDRLKKLIIYSNSAAPFGGLAGLAASLGERVDMSAYWDQDKDIIDPSLSPFRSCAALEEVDLSQSCIIDLPYGFLSNCPNLTTLRLPTTLKTFGNAALALSEGTAGQDASLFILPDGLEAYYALTCGSLTLPESVICVRSDIFETHSVITFLNRTKAVNTLDGNAWTATCTALPTSIPDTCLIRCYKDSFIYNWCVENSIRYQLIEDGVETILTAEVKAPDGTPLSGFAAIRWVDTTTGCEVWVNRLTYNVPAELAGHKFECAIALTAAQLDSYQSLPTITFLFDTAAEDGVTTASLTLGVRKRVTVVGVFPQYAADGFTARLIHSALGIDREIAVGADGRFELPDLLRADGYIIRLDVTGDGERLYKATEVKLNLYAKVNADGTLDPGELTMPEAEPMLSLPVFNDNIRALSMTLIRSSDGAEFHVYYDSHRQAICIRDPKGQLKRGDMVILRCTTNTGSRQYFDDISFAMPGEYADFIMSIHVKQRPRLSCSQDRVRMLVWDADGRLVAYEVTQVFLLPGTYTVIGMDHHYAEQLRESDIATLEGFRALGLPTEALVEQSITVAYGTDPTFDAEVKTFGSVRCDTLRTMVCVYDALGNYCGASINEGYTGSTLYLKPGRYTLIAISHAAFRDDAGMNLSGESGIPTTLDAFGALGFGEGDYARREITLELGDTYTFSEDVPNIIGGVRYTVTMDMSHMDAMGRIPVCINYQKVSDNAQFPLSFMIRTRGMSFGIVDLGGGKYAAIDSPLGLQDMKLTFSSIGYTTLGTLTFTSEAEEGNIWLYITVNSGTYTFDIPNRDAAYRPRTIATLTPEKEAYSVVAPPALTNSDSGVLVMKANYGTGKHIRAEVYVDDELQSASTFPNNSIFSHGLHYTFKTYEDGYSDHEVYVVVRDAATDEQLWCSDIFTFRHTNDAVSEPKNLYIGCINGNNHGSTSSTVMGLGSNGYYGPLNIDAAYGSFDRDGTWKYDITLNFSLEAINPTGLRHVSLRLWCDQTSPFTRNVQMVYNAENGRFEGSIKWSGGTFTAQDLPYGLDVLYTQDSTTVTESYSLTAMLDKLAKKHEERSEWEKADEERRELLRSADIDLFMLLLNQFNAQNPDLAFDEEEMQVLTSLMASWNELCDAHKELDDAIEVWASSMSATGDPYGSLDDILAFCNGTTGTLASASLEGITTRQLLDNGFVVYEYAGRTVYVHRNGVVADMELNALIYSDPANIPSDLYAELFSARMARMGLRGAERELEALGDNMLSFLLGQLLDGLDQASTALDVAIDLLMPSDITAEVKKDNAMAKVLEAEERLTREQRIFDAKMANTEYSLRVKALDEATETILSRYADPKAIQNIKDTRNDIYTYIVRDSFLEHYDQQQAALKPLNEAKASLAELQAELRSAQDTWQTDKAAQKRARLLSIKNGKAMTKFRDAVKAASANTKLQNAGTVVSILSSIIDILDFAFNVYDAGCSIDEKLDLLNVYDDYFKRLYAAYEAGCLKGVSTYAQWRDFIFVVDKAYSEAIKLAKELYDLTYERLYPDYVSLCTTVISLSLPLMVGPVGSAVGFAVDLVSAVGTGLWASYKDDQIADTTEEFWKNVNVIRNALARIDRKAMPDGGRDPDKDDPNGRDNANSSGSRNDPNSPEYPNAFAPRLDPAGFVYEAVYSNRIAGLTAKVFYKGEDGEPVFWADAPLYGEVNPQITDERGQFAWMTTLGEWLVVIYDEDGNEIADSRNDPAAVDGWLPVPPPQMKVYIGITSKDAPTVSAVGTSEAEASNGRLQVTFSRYMDIASILDRPALIRVTQNGKPVEVDIRFSDAEESPTADGVFYGKVMVLTRKDGKAFAGDDIRVTIGGDVKSYAGTCMGQDYRSEAITGAHIHEHEFTEKRPEADYLKTPATCTEKAAYYYACACGEKGSETYTYGETTPHGETELRDYREAAVGVAGYTGDTYCKACDEKLAEGEIIPALPEPETETETETETDAPETETDAPETETDAPETETDAPETETDAPETETHATTGGCGCGSGCGSSISMVSLMSIVLLVAAPGFLRARRKEEEV